MRHHPHNAYSWLIFVLVLSYGVLTRPFLYAFYLPVPVRAFVEIIPLVLLLLTLSQGISVQHFFTAVLAVFLLFNYLANESAASLSVLLFIRASFWLVLYELFRRNLAVLASLRSAFVLLWTVIAISVILSSCLYWIRPESFVNTSFAVNDVNSYDYYNVPLLGNIRIYYMLGGIAVAKVSWYLTEAGPLSFFFALNALAAESLVGDKVASRRFAILNVVAGVCTLSFTFILFLLVAATYLLWTIKSRWLKYVLILLPVSALVLSLCMIDEISLWLLENTSYANRSVRDDLFVEIWSKDILKSMMVGNGTELQGHDVEFVMSAGWQVHLIERGVFFLIALVAWFSRLLKKHAKVAFLLAFYSFSFELVLFPISAIMVVMIAQAAPSRRNEEPTADYNAAPPLFMR